MTLWLTLALMTAAAVFAVLWPLRRRNTAVSSGSDVAVYRDQLEEVERDQAAGLIGKAEAEAARLEVSRRLLAAADGAEEPSVTDGKPALHRRRAVAVAALLLLPVGAGGFYLSLGSPGIPTEPLAYRLNVPPEQRSIEDMVAKVEAHLERNPGDGRGWEVLAPIYLQTGRFDDAVKARRHALEIIGPDAARLGDLGEAMVLAANGVVTAEARSLFERAAVLDREDVMAPYYLGLAAKQDGRRDEAEKTWRALLARAPQGAPWIVLVQNALARIDEKTVPPTGSASAEHGGGSVQEMVDRLAERLKKDGSNLDGWIQLVRSYRVLGQADKATAAIAEAQIALAGDPDKLRRLAESLKALDTELGEHATSAQIAGDKTPPAQSGGTARSAPPAGPTDKEIAAAQALAPEQQTAMIRGMVDRLAERLKADGSDLDGWLRLVRSYKVLGEPNKARAAAADARRALAGEPDKLRRLNEAMKVFDLEG